MVSHRHVFRLIKLLHGQNSQNSCEAEAFEDKKKKAKVGGLAKQDGDGDVSAAWCYVTRSDAQSVGVAIHLQLSCHSCSTASVTSRAESILPRRRRLF